MNLLSFLLLSIAVIIAGHKLICIITEIRLVKRIKKTVNDIDEISKKKKRKEIVELFAEFDTAYARILLIEMAGKKNIPKELVSCFPRLYFKNSIDNKSFILWKEIKNLIPKESKLKILAEYCHGEIVKVELDKETALYVNRIAPIVEKSRRNCPYYKYSSLLGAINHGLLALEKVTKKNEVEFSKIIQTQRMELLWN